VQEWRVSLALRIKRGLLRLWVALSVLWVGAVVATMVSFHAYAETFSGNELLAKCSSHDAGLELSCSTYFLGLLDGHALWKVSSDAPVACIPQQVSVGQVLDVGVRYLKAHPEIRHRSAAFLLRDAFKEAWPCPKSRRPPDDLHSSQKACGGVPRD
jgi:Rap1a immunity proteins